jgi:hypothetical protein
MGQYKQAKALAAELEALGDQEPPGPLIGKCVGNIMISLARIADAAEAQTQVVTGQEPQVSFPEQGEAD